MYLRVPFNARCTFFLALSILCMSMILAARFLANLVQIRWCFCFDRGLTLKFIRSTFPTGIPVFIVQPQKTLEINESSNLHLRIEMDGYPQPSASFRWPHLTDSSATNVPSVQLYPFVYSSTYILNTIDASYCGRILQTTLRNDIGSSSVRNTAVTVLRTYRRHLFQL